VKTNPLRSAAVLSAGPAGNGIAAKSETEIVTAAREAFARAARFGVGLSHLAQTDPDAPHSAVLADEATAVFLPA
jgi:hypothetical protein